MLILHVGLPRCASTSLQVFFSDSVFQKYPSPIVYPSTGLNQLTSTYGHSSSIRYEFIDEHSLFGRSSLDSSLLDELKNLSSGQSPILISSEDLWRCDPEDIRTSLSSAIDISMVRVVAIKRPWLEWIFSLYCHNCKQLAGQGISFSGWVHNVSLDVSYMRSIGKYSIYDHDRLKYISEIFNDSLVILPFPASGNTLHALVKAAGIPEIPNEWKRYHLPKLNSNSPLSQANQQALAEEPRVDTYELAMHIAYNVGSISNPLPSVQDLQFQIDQYLELLSQAK